MKKKRIPVYCIILYILAVLSFIGGIYCYAENVGNCRIAKDGDTWSIMDNLFDPFSFEAGLLWDLALVLGGVTALIARFAPEPAPKSKKQSKYVSYGDAPLAAALGNSRVACRFGLLFLCLAWVAILVISVLSFVEYGWRGGLEMALPFLALGLVLALFFGSLLLYLRKDIGRMKEEIAKRVKRGADPVIFRESSKNSGNRLMVVIAVLIVGAVLLGLLLGNLTSSSGGCTVCHETATHRFQGDAYCYEHYINAINWAFDNVASKN
jgi:hypothetical protein